MRKADGYYTLKIMQESGGAGAAVSDPEVVDGMKLLAESEGIFAETAGGVTIAGLKKLVARGQVDPDEVVVAFITGGGLKTVEAVADALPAPLQVEANIASFEQAVQDRTGQPLATGV